MASRSNASPQQGPWQILRQGPLLYLRDPRELALLQVDFLKVHGHMDGALNFTRT